MRQDRLRDLALMSTERNETKKIDCDDILGEFAWIKAQKLLACCVI